MNTTSAPATPAQVTPSGTLELNDRLPSDELDEYTVPGGYNQIPDTGWWEGEPDAALKIGEHIYQPAEPQVGVRLSVKD